MVEILTSQEEMSQIVDEMSRYPGRFAAMTRRSPCLAPLPDRDAIVGIMEDSRALLFPGYLGNMNGSVDIRSHVGRTIDSITRPLEEEVRRALCFACTEANTIPGCSQRAAELVRRFLRRLPSVQQTLLSDILAAYEGDPACTTPEEAILAYPGVHALTYYRIAHELFDLEIPLLPRIITEIAHSATGIDIHPGATIGERFFIDHGTGVVIGATCIIGNRVRLYQGVTLGAKSFQTDEEGRLVKGIPRHPIIEDDVIIYAGATILGRVTIGKESVIGGNVWLTHGVPAGSRITQINAG